MARLILFILIIYFINLPVYSAIKGGLEYSVPIDYNQIQTKDFESKADFYYNNALKTENHCLNEDITNALNLYSILSNKAPQNLLYAVRLGKLYDIIGKDRYAKGCYARAVSVNPARPEPYFYMGDFFYSRKQYRRALKYYKQAYEHGYSNHYQTLLQLGKLYQKLGDKDNADLFLQKAAETLSEK